MDYWKECISEALEDAELKATDEQIKTITAWVEGAHENYGMAHGYDAIPNPVNAEVERLRKEIKRIEEKHETQLRGIRKGVAQRRGVDISDVYIEESGLVKYNLR